MFKFHEKSVMPPVWYLVFCTVYCECLFLLRNRCLSHLSKGTLMGFHWNEDMYGIISVEKVYHSGSITVIESRLSHSFCTIFYNWFTLLYAWNTTLYINYAAAKSLQSCPTLCDPIDGSPPGSPIPGSLQARTLEWVAISFSNAWKWKVKLKSISRVQLLVTPWTAAYQAPPSMGDFRQEYWSGLPLSSPINQLYSNANF